MKLISLCFSVAFVMLVRVSFINEEEIIRKLSLCFLRVYPTNTLKTIVNHSKNNVAKYGN